MEIKIISSENRVEVNEFVSSHWFTTDMVVRGEAVDMTVLDGFVAYEMNTIVGLVTYRYKDIDECEIMSLDSLKERHGLGTELVKRVADEARDKKCKKLVLITTNDNINAIRFYQKRGFDMAKIYTNSVEVARKIKPSIPLVGDYGIPIKHEIEFELKLV